MTIRGDGSSLVIYELAQIVERPPELEDATDVLFSKLISDEVDYDTTAGLIEFPYSNGQSDLLGNTTWTRLFQDWVYLRLREMDVSEETKDAHTLVINGLHERARQKLGLE